MKTKNFFLTAGLVLATALTGMMMTSCSKVDNPVADDDGYEGNPPMPQGRTVDLSKLSDGYKAQNGDTLTGKLDGPYRISIADGATVTLSGATIQGGKIEDIKWAGITCEGSVTIVLADGSKNEVKGSENCAGIQVGGELTICGAGELSAIGGDHGAGIGTGYSGKCGDITIKGGTINATGGMYAAGIGSGFWGECRNIIISQPAKGTAKGNDGAYDIGAGAQGTCSTIIVASGTISGRCGGSNGAVVDPVNGGGNPEDGPQSF